MLRLSSRRGLVLSLSLSLERGPLNAWLFSISKNEIGIKEHCAATNSKARGGGGAEGDEEVERPQRRHSHNNMAMAM